MECKMTARGKLSKVMNDLSAQQCRTIAAQTAIDNKGAEVVFESTDKGVKDLSGSGVARGYGIDDTGREWTEVTLDSRKAARTYSTPSIPPP